MADFFIRRPIVAMVIAILTVIVGLISLKRLPISEYPPVSPTMIQVTTTYRGAAAEAVMESVATPIESKVNGVDKLLYHAVLQCQRRQAHAERLFRRGHGRGHHAGERAEPRRSGGCAVARCGQARGRHRQPLQPGHPDGRRPLFAQATPTTRCSWAITATSTWWMPSSACGAWAT